LSLSSGMMAIVPQNTWHQFDAPDGVSVMTATPQPEHLTGARNYGKVTPSLNARSTCRSHGCVRNLDSLRYVQKNITTRAPITQLLEDSKRRHRRIRLSDSGSRMK
jgi:hypothetical protein